MSLEIANNAPSGFLSENVPESNKNLKRIYTREFLLSFKDLERCKKLPNGVDPSVISELEDTSSSSVPERSRGRGEYGSTLTRFDSSSSFSKGSSGRWDTRSTGSSDRDADSQSERDTFAPERKYGNHNRKSWQGSSGGHDGLLGKPSGFVSGTSPNSRPSVPYQLKRSSEPYQPPRPYKPAPYLRRDGVDSCNDETFGSSEQTQDRAEEERKRRASFEMMRKEQHKELHKSLQEKQNQRQKDAQPSGDHLLDLLQSSNNSQGTILENEDLNDHGTLPTVSPPDPSNKPSLARPVVPPGFASSSVGDRKLQKGPSDASIESEMKNGATEAQNFSVTVGNKEHNAKSSPNLSQVWDAFINHEDKESGSIGVVTSSSDQNNSVSILERFFGSTLSKPSAPSTSFVQIENQTSEAEEEIINPSSLTESSKFAQWFIEEDAMPPEDTSSKDLLSLFAKNLDKKSAQSPQTSLTTTEKMEFEQVLPETLILEPIAPNGLQKQDISTNTEPAVLTCEDLEQLMLSQASGSTNNKIASNDNPDIFSPNLQVGGESDGANMDNTASHHLLSLLHKGAPATMMGKDPEIAPSTNPEATAGSGNNVTLEALFGAAFMNELHSMDAPVSSHREGPSEPQFLDPRNGNSNNILFQGFHDREMNVNLPEEENLFSVNDPSLNIQPNPNSLLPFTNPSKTKVALHDASVGDLSNRMINIGLGPDNSTPISHLRMPDNVPVSHVGRPQDINPNQRMRFLGPEGVLHDPSHQFHIDPVAQHVPVPHPMQNAHYGTVGFGPEMDPVRHTLPRNGPVPPVPHPMHQVHPSFLSHEASGLPNFPMHQQPNFGPGIGIGMAGPGPLEFGVRNQAHPEALERILQMEMRAKSQQAGRIPGFHGGTELGADIRYR